MKSIQLNIQNCNGAGTVTKLLPIIAANCLKSVGLTFKCGIAPYTVTVALEGSTTNIGTPAIFTANTGTFTYSVPNDGLARTFIITVKDSTGNIMQTFTRTNIKC